jgi:hypothetical protein
MEKSARAMSLSNLQTRPRRTALVLLALAAVVVAGYWLLVYGPGVRLVSPPQSTVTEFAGTSDQTTGSFEVRAGWRLRWQSSGPSFVVAIRGDPDLGVVVNVSEPAGGVASPAAAGRFHLDITARGEWTVRVEQGE